MLPKENKEDTERLRIEWSGGFGKPLQKRKITMEVETRLVVKVSAERFPRPQDPPKQPEDPLWQEPGFWKVSPVWKVSMTAEPDPEFTFENSNPGSRDVTWYDGHAVAEEFLNLQSPEAALTFFQKYYFGETKRPDANQKNRIRWSELQVTQKIFASALKNEPIPPHLREFVYQSLEMNLLHEEGVHIPREKNPKKKTSPTLYDKFAGVADCADVLHSLRAVTFLSRGVVWRLCANPDCGIFFPCGRPDQIYHDPACTRRAVANRFYERTRKENKKRKRGKR
jgi:hypothetical protein